jgi:hypothetical protein
MIKGMVAALAIAPASAFGAGLFFQITPISTTRVPYDAINDSGQILTD